MALFKADKVHEGPSSMEMVDRLWSCIVRDADLKKLPDEERNYVIIRLTNRLKGHLKAAGIDLSKYFR
jgi:hypothetical protein